MPPCHRPRQPSAPSVQPKDSKATRSIFRTEGSDGILRVVAHNDHGSAVRGYAVRTCIADGATPLFLQGGTLCMGPLPAFASSPAWSRDWSISSTGVRETFPAIAR